MSAQMNYGFATGRAIAGEIYDMFHYPVDSRWNEEKNGILRSGVGVVAGTIPGKNVVLPTGGKTVADFEGIVVNGMTQGHDLEGKVTIRNNQNIGVMRYGRIWVRLAAEQTPAYGDPVHLIVEGGDAGCFATEGGVEIAGRFLGDASDGLAPIELYSVPAAVPAKEQAADPKSTDGKTV